MKNLVLIALLIAGCSESAAVKGGNTTEKASRSVTEQKPAKPMTLRIPVEGMTCEACESAISRALLRIDGVTKATASHKAQSVDVAFDGNKVKAAQLKKAIDDLGYTAILPGH